MSIDLIGADWRLDFASYPGLHWGVLPAGLGVAWTLGAELVFSLITPVLLQKRVSVLLISFVLSFVTRLALVNVYGYNITWAYIFPRQQLYFS